MSKQKVHIIIVERLDDPFSYCATHTYLEKRFLMWLLLFKTLAKVSNSMLL